MSDANSSEPDQFQQAFPGDTPITLKDLAVAQQRPLVVLQRWARENRFRHVLAKHGPGKPKILVPLSEFPVIAAMPRGSGHRIIPWQERLRRLGNSQTTQGLSLDSTPRKVTFHPDGRVEVEFMEREQSVEKRS